MSDSAVPAVDEVDRTSTFDGQAPQYDERAGLPSPIGAVVARSIIVRTAAGPSDLVAELGAGTGQIGVHLWRLPIQYAGFDVSAEMLAEFAAKAPDAASSLTLSDCNHTWPLRDHSVAVVFASRVVHLLDPHRVMRETLRVSRPGGFLILGRVLREPQSLKERMRRRRQDVLEEAGIPLRQGERGHRQVIEACLAAGGTSLGRRVVAAWTGETTPNQIIGGWEKLSRMGSVPVDSAVRTSILAEIRDWIRREIGGMDRPEPFLERYAIDIVRLPNPGRQW